MTEKNSDLFRASIANSPGLHRMLSIKEVREIIPLSTRQIDRLIKAHAFPSPIFISPNRRVWSEQHIRQFIRDKQLIGQTSRGYRTTNSMVQEAS